MCGLAMNGGGGLDAKAPPGARGEVSLAVGASSWRWELV